MYQTLIYNRIGPYFSSVYPSGLITACKNGTSRLVETLSNEVRWCKENPEKAVAVLGFLTALVATPYFSYQILPQVPTLINGYFPPKIGEHILPPNMTADETMAAYYARFERLNEDGLVARALGRTLTNNQNMDL